MHVSFSLSVCNSNINFTFWQVTNTRTQQNKDRASAELAAVTRILFSAAGFVKVYPL